MRGKDVFSVQYVCQCVGYANGSTCLDPATASQCAWGEGSACQACPEGALCPGGPRLWPQPGFWVANERAATVVACDPPHADRCIGWSLRLNKMTCKAGYDTDSEACRGCRSQFYPDSPNQCTRCPESVALWDRIAPSLLVLGALIGGLALLTLVPFVYTMLKIRTIRKLHGDEVAAQTRSSLIAGLTPTLSLGLAFLLMVVQASRYLPAAVPVFLRLPLEYLQPLMLDLPTVHPVCVGAPPMQRQEAILSCLLAAVVVFYGLCILRFTALGYNLRPLARGMHEVLAVLFPVAASVAIESLDCRSTNGGLQWRPNLYVVCFGPDHVTSAGLAIAVMGGYVIALPVITLIALRRHRSTALREADRDSRSHTTATTASASKLSVSTPAGQESPLSATDPVIAVYTEGEMAADHSHYYHIMYASSVVIAIDVQLLRDRGSNPGLMWLGWVLVVCCVCLGRVAYLVRHSPYRDGVRFIRWVEIVSLVGLMGLRSTVLVLLLTSRGTGAFNTVRGLAIGTGLWLMAGLLSFVVMVYVLVRRLGMLAVKTVDDAATTHGTALSPSAGPLAAGEGGMVWLNNPA